ncbi:MAG: globin domain-containing protein [Phenylobacterium sp.]
MKATVPALRAHGVAITTAMYARLFEDPSIKALFNQDHHGPDGRQPRALAMAVLAYAEHIDDLAPLAGAIETIASRHVAIGIQPGQYHAVADALLGAMGEVLGEAATPDVLQAWGEAYWRLAAILQAREANLYAEQAGAAA